MERNEVKEKVVSVINDRLTDDPVTEEAKLVDDFGADSLDCVEICIDLERGFNINITDEEFDSTFNEQTTVGEIIDFICKKVG